MPQKKCNGRIEHMLSIAPPPITIPGNNFMQQQALIMEMARDVPKQNFSIEKGKLHYFQAQIICLS